MKSKSEALPRRKEGTVSLGALNETLYLYNGWLAYLLKRLGEREICVEADELRRALETLSCRVEKVEKEGNGGAYVIRMEETATAAREEDSHEPADNKSDPS